MDKQTTAEILRRLTDIVERVYDRATSPIPVYGMGRYDGIPRDLADLRRDIEELTAEVPHAE